MPTFSNYNSPEYKILKDVFENIPMMDTYIANVVEEYIYSTVKEYYPEKEGGLLNCEYLTKYGKKHGKYKNWFYNGQLYVQIFYKDGKEHGEYKEWDEYGNIDIKTTYINSFHS